MLVIIDGVWIDDLMYWTLCYTAREYTLQFTVTHIHSSVHSHVFTAVAW
jgi:hypothetical protein